MNSQSILREQNDSDATLSDGSGSASDLNIDSDFEEKDDVFSQNDRLGKYGNIDMSYRHSMHRDMTPPSSRMRIRENRSPSKVYEDTLIMERKIRSFGLFSEDLSWILMGLLKDNEEMKNIIKVGFKEVEREISDIDGSIKKETKQRVKENLELKYLVNSKNNEFEEHLIKLEKEMKINIFNLKENLQNSMDEFKKEIDTKIVEVIDCKLPDVRSELNDMSAKMSLVFTSQDEKLQEVYKALDNQKEELNHLINKTSEDLNQVAESNLEDTTMAVVSLRKEIADSLKAAEEKRSEEKLGIEANVKQVKKEILDEIKLNHDQNEIDVANIREIIDDLKKRNFESCQDLKEFSVCLQNTVSCNKAEVDTMIKDLTEQQAIQFKNAREALSSTISNISMDIDKVEQAIGRQDERLNDKISSTMDILKFNQKEANDKIVNLSTELHSSMEDMNNRNEIMNGKIGIAEIENKKFVDNLNAKLNEKVEQLNETTTNSEKSLRSLVQEQEKIIRSEIKSNMSDLEENLKHLDDGIGAKLKQQADDIEMINLKRSNERQEVAQVLREDMKTESENVFLDMINFIKAKGNTINETIEHLKQKQVESLQTIDADVIKKVEILNTNMDGLKNSLCSDMEKHNLTMSEKFEDIYQTLTSKLATMDSENIKNSANNLKSFDDMKQELLSLYSELKEFTELPLSQCFTAFKDDEYFGKGEEILRFTGCSVNTNDIFDPRTGIFTAPISGHYLLMLTVCSQDKKKVLISLRRNGEELASLYDQNHNDNHSNSMSSQVFITKLCSGDQISVYFYTNTGVTDRKSNHFTQFSGLFLR